MSWSQVAAWRQSAGRHVVFTNGVFDLLHRGHVDVLTAAREHGSDLVVGINADASVRRLKGDTRPVRGESDRAYVLAALEVVDAVVIFEQDTPAELIAVVRPDVLVKGGDYAAAEVVGAREVESWGGRVVIVPLTPGQSTTSIIRRFSNAK
ncbi:MAG: D-glycero-beta-D-manno-heptose 1-phosphate adenylyltransferase [Gemmatimonadaceae bacterium]